MDKIYNVHSIVLTVQGEGYHAGKLAVFVRMASCDIWTGREEDRIRDAGLKSACAGICDTEFRGCDEKQSGGKYTALELAHKINSFWPWPKDYHPEPTSMRVVFTGGEPCLQLDDSLCQAVRGYGGKIHVETNGRHEVSPYVDWVTLSPKPPPSGELGLAWLRCRRPDELKVLYPLYDPLIYEEHNWKGIERPIIKWVQPVDPLQRCDGQKGLNFRQSVEACFKFVQEHPDWRISTQGHKLLCLP